MHSGPHVYKLGQVVHVIFWKLILVGSYSLVTIEYKSAGFVPVWRQFAFYRIPKTKKVSPRARRLFPRFWSFGCSQLIPMSSGTGSFISIYPKLGLCSYGWAFFVRDLMSLLMSFISFAVFLCIPLFNVWFWSFFYLFEVFLLMTQEFLDQGRFFLLTSQSKTGFLGDLGVLLMWVWRFWAWSMTCMDDPVRVLFFDSIILSFMWVFFDSFPPFLDMDFFGYLKKKRKRFFFFLIHMNTTGFLYDPMDYFDGFWFSFPFTRLVSFSFFCKSEIIYELSFHQI